MKKRNLKSILLLIATALLSACAGGSSDVPGYALGEGCYFVPEKGEQVIFGNNPGVLNVETIGYDEYNRLLKISGYEMDFDGKKFTLVSAQYSPANSRIQNTSYKIHAVIKQANKENPYFKEGEYYADSFYFVDAEELNKAIETFNGTPETKNEKSKFNAADHEEGVQTYKSKIVSVVGYVGSENGSDRGQFSSIYLECKAVVHLSGDRVDSKDVGGTIDCVVDKNNKIVEYEFI